MLTPSKSDCVTILSAASQLSSPTVRTLHPDELGLSLNQFKNATAFLGERACFTSFHVSSDACEVGSLSLQGRLRLDQLTCEN